MESPLQRIRAVNVALSRKTDVAARRLAGRRDGNYAFLEETLPSLLAPRQRVLDVGGGKRPSIPLDVKQELGLEVWGLDVSADELSRAPVGAYDHTIVGPVETVALPTGFDLVFSCALLEHVQDVPGAIKNLIQAVRPGGQMAHFIPCRNAPFARLNRLAGAERARQLLFSLNPQAHKAQGFPAYYDACVPSEIRRLLEAEGLVVEKLTGYFASGYGSFFFPLHLAEVSVQLINMKLLRAEDHCESFDLIATRPG